MTEYRVTFHDGPESDRSKNVDIIAENFDDAFHKAYQMPEAKKRLYTNVSIMEKPKGRTIIGIKHEYEDTYFHKTFVGYTFVRADSESDAAKYYNDNIRGKHFWFDESKIEPDGKNVFGKILETYFACGGRAFFEA